MNLESIEISPRLPADCSSVESAFLHLASPASVSCPSTIPGEPTSRPAFSCEVVSIDLGRKKIAQKAIRRNRRIMHMIAEAKAAVGQ